MIIGWLAAILSSAELYSLGLLGSGKSLNIGVVGGASVTGSHWHASCIKFVETAWRVVLGTGGNGRSKVVGSGFFIRYFSLPDRGDRVCRQCEAASAGFE